MKKTWILCILTAIFLGIGSGCSTDKETASQATINNSFNVNLRSDVPALYEKNTKDGFHGDGEVYLVLDYRDFQEDIKDDKYSSKRNQEMETTVSDILDTLKIAQKNRPDFTAAYEWKTVTFKEKEDALYLIYVPQQKRLYALANYI